MLRLGLLSLLAASLPGCAEDADRDAVSLPSLSVELDRGEAVTNVSGCYFGGFVCDDGAAPMLVRFDGEVLEAPYRAAILGGSYQASTDRMQGGDTVSIDFDGETADIELPFDVEFVAPLPVAATAETRVAWTPSANATTTSLSAQWLCNDERGGAYSSAPLATFETVDPGEITVDVPASRPSHLSDRDCSVTLRVMAERTTRSGRLGVIARQSRTLALD